MSSEFVWDLVVSKRLPKHILLGIGFRLWDFLPLFSFSIRQPLEPALAPSQTNILPTSGGGNRKWVPRDQLVYFNRLVKGP